MTEQLEKHILDIEDDELPDFLSIKGLDVSRFPSGVIEEDSDVDNDLEWTYTIDLDRKVFSICDSAHFKLDKIPRDGLWIKALKKDTRGRWTIDMDVCPAECIASPEMSKPRMDAQEAKGLRVKYKELAPTIVNANARIEKTPGGHHAHQCFHALVYVSFVQFYFDNFVKYALTWTPEDFTFQEMAFAMLSIAAGRVRFENHSRQSATSFDGDWRKYAVINVAKGQGMDGSTMIPNFPLGTHLPDVERGSSPGDTMYWFEDVLVCLATGLHEREWLEAHVAKVVKYALWHGKTAFEAVVMDLMYVVLLDVQVKDGETIVRHTMPLQLLPINRQDHLSTHPEERPPKSNAQGDDNKESENSTEDDPLVDPTFPPQGGLNLLQSQDLYKSEENLELYLPGVIALMNIFNTAKNRTYDRHRTTRGVFPTEIYNRIVDFIPDRATQHACSDVSPAFRAYCRRHFWIHGITILDGFEFQGEKSRLPILTVSHAGETQRMRVYHRPHRSFGGSSFKLCVVFGGKTRPSVLTKVGMRYIRIQEVKRPGSFGSADD